MTRPAFSPNVQITPRDVSSFRELLLKSINGRAVSSFIKRNVFSIAYCVLVGVIIAQHDSGLGVHNFFIEQDGYAQRGLLDQLQSPSLLTAFCIVSFSFIAWFFMHISFKRAASAGPNAPLLNLRGLFYNFTVPTMALSAIYLFVWLAFGRELLEIGSGAEQGVSTPPDDGTPAGPDVNALRDGEVWRIAAGYVIGLTASFATMVVFARMLSLIADLIRDPGLPNFLTHLVKKYHEYYPTLFDHVWFWGGLLAFVVVLAGVIWDTYALALLVSIIATQIFLYVRSDDLADKPRARRYVCYAWVLVSAVAVVFFMDRVIPAVGLFALLALVFAVPHILLDFPFWPRVGILATTVLGLLTYNMVHHYAIDDRTFKLTFAGITGPDNTDHYDKLLSIKKYERDQAKPKPTYRNICSDGSVPERSPFTPTQPARGTYSLIDPTVTLFSWKRRLEQTGLIVNGQKPKLVIVATSGGAYRSAFWTNLVLDKIATDKRFTGLLDSVRLITGASGGMVGAAYFAALADGGADWRQTRRNENGGDPRTLQSVIERDIRLSQTAGAPNSLGRRFETSHPIPRDSFGPVAQQLLQGDLPSIFLPHRVDVDRGTVLEQQWLTLDRTFADLREGELEGWRPSMIFSPMMIETGQPLLISNLDLSKLDRVEGNQAEVFFDMFRCSMATFKIATAVRMNATFPYISPAVSLPTIPPRRVVDAGYYDNYGVSMASAFLIDDNISEWIIKHTSGVIVLQLRAFPLGSGVEFDCGKKPEKKTVGESDAVTKDHQTDEIKPERLNWHSWATSPVEGAISARGKTMVFRNTQELESVKKFYANKIRANLLTETVNNEPIDQTRLPEHALAKRKVMHDKASAFVGDSFIDSFILVNSTDVSMTWQMSESEFKQMEVCLDDQWNARSGTLLEIWDRGSGAFASNGDAGEKFARSKQKP